VDIDLPVGYHSHPHRRWPVTYVLAGVLNTYASFNDVVDGLALTRSYPSIVVSPNGDSGRWSNWYNCGRFGAPKYETYVVDQLIPLIDRTFRTIPRRAERAVAGVSMGGYGAMMLAALHPGVFADAASLSGAVDTNFGPIAQVVSSSPLVMGKPEDAIYGSQTTQEVRWRGHNPTTLAPNLHGLRLQVRTADGRPDPALGESALGPDAAACVAEAGVERSSVDLHKRLRALHIPHLWRNYGTGCHTAPNFEREIRDTLRLFARDLAHPRPKPARFTFRSIARSFRVYGWRVHTDPRRALEFLQLSRVSRRGLTLTGSGTTTVTTPPLFYGARRVLVHGAVNGVAIPDRLGRITFRVALGRPDAQQEYTAGATTRQQTKTVTFRPV
jgi:S-formylglutathione hydrolase FrmB